MGLLSSCWSGIKSAANTVKKFATTAAIYVYAARGVIFVAGMATIVVRELGWDKAFGYEAACDMATFTCEQDCVPSKSWQLAAPYIVYGIQVLSSSLMFAAYAPNFWKSTNFSKIKQHFCPDDTLVPLSRKMKMVFAMLILSAVGYYGVGILRNELGDVELLSDQFYLDSRVANLLAYAMTGFWMIVSAGVKMPAFIASTYGICKNPKLPSFKRGAALSVLGGAMGISMADYLSRFIESYGQDAGDYAPAVALAFVCSFIFAVFTSGSSLDDIPALVAKLKQRKAMPIIVAALLSVDSLVWWVFNSIQLAGRIENWVAPPSANITVLFNNTQTFKYFCEQRVATRMLDVNDRAVIVVFSALIAVPQTLCMSCYMMSLILRPRANERNGNDHCGYLPINSDEIGGNGSIVCASRGCC